MKWSSAKINEIFWTNILKHDLTQREWKVIVAFVVDSPNFFITQETLAERTRILQPNINHVLKTLVSMGILYEKDNDYYLSEEIQKPEYIPLVVSGADFKAEKLKNLNKGNGNFKKQSEIKKQNIINLENSVRKIHQESKLGGPPRYYGFGNPDDYEIDEINYRVKSDHPRYLILPDEEIIRYLESLEYTPEEILLYIRDYNIKDDYALKHGLKIR